MMVWVAFGSSASRNPLRTRSRRQGSTNLISLWRGRPTSHAHSPACLSICRHLHARGLANALRKTKSRTNRKTDRSRVARPRTRICTQLRFSVQQRRGLASTAHRLRSPPIPTTGVCFTSLSHPQACFSGATLSSGMCSRSKTCSAHVTLAVIQSAPAILPPFATTWLSSTRSDSREPLGGILQTYPARPQTCTARNGARPVSFLVTANCNL